MLLTHVRKCFGVECRHLKKLTRRTQTTDRRCFRGRDPSGWGKCSPVRRSGNLSLHTYAFICDIWVDIASAYVADNVSGAQREQPRIYLAQSHSSCAQIPRRILFGCSNNTIRSWFRWVSHVSLYILKLWQKRTKQEQQQVSCGFVFLPGVLGVWWNRRVSYTSYIDATMTSICRVPGIFSLVLSWDVRSQI